MNLTELNKLRDEWAQKHSNAVDYGDDESCLKDFMAGFDKAVELQAETIRKLTEFVEMVSKETVWGDELKEEKSELALLAEKLLEE